RFPTNEVLKRLIAVAPPGEVRFADDGAAAAFLPPLVLDLVADLADRDRHQQVPQVAAVLHLRKAPLFRAPAEAVKGAEDRLRLRRPAPPPPAAPPAPARSAGWQSAARAPEPLRDPPLAGSRTTW